ncbi:MAG: SLC13 family permease, partial [Pseudomonadales bacterium]
MISSIQKTPQVNTARVLLPMCFAATLGGTMTLIGTSTNLVVNSMWVKQGHEAIEFFDLTPIGLIVFLLGAIVLYFTSLMLPEKEMVEEDVEEYFVEAKLESASSLVGKTVEEFSGNVKKIQVLDQFDGLKLFAHKTGLLTQELTEVAIKQDSNLVGKSLKETGFRAKFDAAVVAIRREGEQVSGKLGEVHLRAGDLLLLATGT